MEMNNKNNEIVRVRLQGETIDIVQLLDGSILTFNDVIHDFEIIGREFVFNINGHRINLKYKNEELIEPPISELQKINNL